MDDSRAQLGQEAEELISRRLAANGFTVLDRNWRRPWGELDIVARKDGVIHFVEVKASRRYADGFTPELRADERKLIKVRRTARTWLANNCYSPDTEWQIDVASVIMDDASAAEVEFFLQV
jgi:putative endonuclease